MSRKHKRRHSWDWCDEEEVRELLGESDDWDDCRDYEDDWGEEAADARTDLRDLGSGERHRFIGIVERFGTKRGYKGRTEETVMLRNIRLAEEGMNGHVLTDHLWFTKGVQFDNLDCKGGDLIAFDARVAGYWKGYRGWRDDVYGKPVRYDYKLGRPTRFEKLDREVEEASARAEYESALALASPDAPAKLSKADAVRNILRAREEAKADACVRQTAIAALKAARTAAFAALRTDALPIVVSQTSVGTQPAAAEAS